MGVLQVVGAGGWGERTRAAVQSSRAIVVSTPGLLLAGVAAAVATPNI